MSSKAMSLKGKIKNYATVAELENLHISTEDKNVFWQDCRCQNIEKNL